MQLYDIECENNRKNGLTERDVVRRLELGEFPFYSLIYGYELNRWTLIPSCEPIARLLCLRLISKQRPENEHSLFDFWSLQSTSSKKYWSLVEILKSLQDDTLTDSSMIQHPQFPKWMPISQLDFFSPRNRNILFQLLELQSSLSFRKNLRIRYQKKMIAKKGDQTIKGMSWSLSKQGLGFDTFQKTDIQVKDRIQLTLMNFLDKQNTTFDCEVVSVQPKSIFDSIGVRFDPNCELEDEVLIRITES